MFDIDEGPPRQITCSGGKTTVAPAPSETADVGMFLMNGLMT
jgi:hypothetical protein